MDQQTPSLDPEDAEKIAGLVVKYSVAFDELCAERDKVGREHYGTFTFLGNDVVRMMMEELADTSNYCRMQFIKLMMLQAMLEDKLPGEEIQLGAAAFRGTGVGWKKDG
jgi:hypothetical protein